LSPTGPFFAGAFARGARLTPFGSTELAEVLEGRRELDYDRDLK
jgi:hypothetical protein